MAFGILTEKFLDDFDGTGFDDLCSVLGHKVFCLLDGGCLSLFVELRGHYENKQLNQASIRVVNRIIEQRRFLGKSRKDEPPPKKGRTTAEGLVTAYKRQVHRQKLLVKRAKICEARLVFVVNPLKRLIGEENFATLLRAEHLDTMPDYVATRLKAIPT
jgi:ParB family chromosome partitioning protein